MSASVKIVAMVDFECIVQALENMNEKIQIRDNEQIAVLSQYDTVISKLSEGSYRIRGHYNHQFPQQLANEYTHQFRMKEQRIQKELQLLGEKKRIEEENKREEERLRLIEAKEERIKKFAKQKGLEIKRSVNKKSKTIQYALVQRFY